MEQRISASFAGGSKGRRRFKTGWIISALLLSCHGDNDKKTKQRSINGVSNMGSLTKCPECHGEFQSGKNGVLVCERCGYWTRENTARMESILLYEEVEELL